VAGAERSGGVGRGEKARGQEGKRARRQEGKKAGRQEVKG